MIAFSCPHCKAQLQVKDSRAGTTAPCPSCSGVVQAPSSSRLSPTGSDGKQGSAVRYSHLPTLGLSSAAEDTDLSLPKLAPPKEYPFLAPPEAPDELGRLGHYAVLKVLGVGAMGVVFQAQDLHLKRMVALKVVKPSLAAYADSHKRFLREAQLAASIDHEHIVTIYQVGEDRGVLFLAMKLLEGESLDRRVNRLGRLPLAEVLRIGREMAEGLGAAHARGLIHRDIKPANIWLEKDRNRVKIVDFGLACGNAEDGRLTQAGAVIGTPSYMAPEQANAKELDSRCDLFSLGAVLYQISTGVLPFGGKDTLSVLAALASKTPVAPHKIVPSLPRAFSDFVMNLLVKDRDKRVQTAKEVIEAINVIECTPATPIKDEVPPADKIKPEPKPQSSSASAVSSKATKSREKGRTGSAIKQKAKAKAPISESRKKKQTESIWTASRIVLIVAIVLFSIAFVVFSIGIYKNSTRPRSAIQPSGPGYQDLAQPSQFT
jgi:serine/threonine protein kinase